MRIGIDARLWNETGVGRYIRNLVAELSKIDGKNEYILFLRKKEYESLLLPSKNFQKRLADIRWHSFSEQSQFSSLLNREKLDLMHFPYFSVPFLYRNKFVITIHDLIIHHFETGEASTLSPLFYKAKRIGYKFIIQSAAKRAEKIITVSESTKQEIIDHLNVSPEKIVVTYEGIDEKLIKYDAKYTGMPGIKSYFLYVGNAYPHKNLSFLINSFIQFKIERKDSKTKLLLVGKNDYFYKRCEEKIASGYKKDIVFLHSVDDLELRYLYLHAKAYVMPSLMEGFGVPLIEAMANKCLVLASDIPVHREVCLDAALYFNPQDTYALTHLLTETAQSPRTKYSDIRERGKKRASSFSWERLAKETLNVYYDACKR